MRAEAVTFCFCIDLIIFGGSMAHLTKYGRRMRLTLVSAMSAACMACIVAIPFVEKKILKNDVGYISISVNGKEVGAANTQEEAKKAVTEARLRFIK